MTMCQCWQLQVMLNFKLQAGELIQDVSNSCTEMDPWLQYDLPADLHWHYHPRQSRLSLIRRKIDNFLAVASRSEDRQSQVKSKEGTLSSKGINVMSSDTENSRHKRLLLQKLSTTTIGFCCFFMFCFWWVFLILLLSVVFHSKWIISLFLVAPSGS